MEPQNGNQFRKWCNLFISIFFFFFKWKNCIPHWVKSLAYNQRVYFLNMLLYVAVITSAASVRHPIKKLNRPSIALWWRKQKLMLTAWDFFLYINIFALGSKTLLPKISMYLFSCPNNNHAWKNCNKRHLKITLKCRTMKGRPRLAPLLLHLGTELTTSCAALNV